ncbi:MAG: pantoate--beta-alanine ligase [Methylophilaceae bacterium]|nr:pantoate--beta-alanine ligase [Methylophilaceae bacterium]
MQVISSAKELRQHLASAAQGISLAFVPTMGNLHAGHISLVEQAKQQAQFVVVSIFVNPLQFGANEDLSSYPRTLDEDIAKLRLAGVDVVFTPTESEIYPVLQTVTIELPEIANTLCGAIRPGHFRGVATVVLKLFNLVFFGHAPRKIALFGKKDFQQLFIIRQLAQQLNIPIEILAGETMRETDGLAMSSRNAYLKPAQRQEAQRLYRALQQVVQAVQTGRTDFATIETQTGQYLTQLGWIVDYISLRSAASLAPATADDQQLIVLGAARQGRTRLIDNIEFGK